MAPWHSVHVVQGAAMHPQPRAIVRRGQPHIVIVPHHVGRNTNNGGCYSYVLRD